MDLAGGGFRRKRNTLRHLPRAAEEKYRRQTPCQPHTGIPASAQRHTPTVSPMATASAQSKTTTPSTKAAVPFQLQE